MKAPVVFQLRASRLPAFTLLELLVVIAIIGILAALLLPALRGVKQQAEGIRCLGNLKQFSLAWNLYADDHEERIAPNYGRPGPYELRTNNWVEGWLEHYSPSGVSGWPDNTNTDYLRNSLLAPYLGESIEVWRCPGDRSMSLRGGELLPRVRSYSMNSYLNSRDRGHPIPWRIARKRTELVDPGPEMTFVFVDEREDSINDGYFNVDMDGEPPILYATPRSAHTRSGTLSYADGHAELKKWLDPVTFLPVRQQTHFHKNVDIYWLRERTTGHRKGVSQ